MNQRFPKEERLKSLKKIQFVINKGKVIRFGCIKVHWMTLPVDVDSDLTKVSFLKAGFSVPKKKIKRAYGRNQIRRKMKEIFRLRKKLLYEHIPEGQQLLLFIIYQSDRKINYPTIEYNLLNALQRIQENLNRKKKTNTK